MPLAAPTTSRSTESSSSAAPSVVQPGLPIGLVYLHRWPELPTQLNEHEMLVNSVCALLSNKPRASHLIHLLLRAPKDDVMAALRTLLQSGCVRIGQASTVPGTGTEASAKSATGTTSRKSSRKSRSKASVETSEPASVLGKLWTKISN